MTILILSVYQLLFPFIAIGVLARLLALGRSRALREGTEELRQRLGLIRASELATLRQGAARVVWFHAASVGEVSAAAPLLRLIANSGSRPKILLTASTVAGREKARSSGLADCALLAPMDFFPAVLSFLKRAKPGALILLETELWPMTIALAHRRGLRLGLANGRVTERAFARYRWMRGFMASLLGLFERAAIQTQEDAERYAFLGLPRAAISVAGNTKYDAQVCASPALQERLKFLGWGEDPFWIAASTHRGEEEILTQAQRLARRRMPRLRWVLAPRHPERAAEAAALLTRLGMGFALWSDLEASPPAAPPECLLVDRLGVLASLYAGAWAAFVGGTLTPVGGHNLLEPAFAAIPVIFGPYTASTRAPAAALLKSDGGTLVDGPPSLAEALLKLLENPAYRKETGRKALSVARSFSGASERTLAHLRPLIFTNGRWNVPQK